MKTLFSTLLLLTVIVWADEATPVVEDAAPEIVAEPPNGMKSAKSHDIGYDFLRLLDEKAGFPKSNDWKKNKLTRYISSGSAGHSITIYGVQDSARQIEILGMAQTIVNQGDFGRVYIEFRDAERFAEAGGGWQSRSGEKTLRSRIIKKAEQAGAGQPATRPGSKIEGGDKPQPESEGRSR
jgi:hypothetical protein